jgi:hypothetical protein
MWRRFADAADAAHEAAPSPTADARANRRAAAPPAGPDTADEFIAWLRFANAGMLEKGNLACFDHAISRLPGNAPILEIGSFCGLSTNILIHYKRCHGATNPLFTCDPWLFEGSEAGGKIPGSNLTFTAYRAFVRETFLRNVRMFSADDLPFTIERGSDDFFDGWRAGEPVRDVFDRPVRLGGPISFCYIDGNHTYPYARRDFDNCDAMLEKGGFLLFDDSADGSGWGVCDVVREVAADPRYEIVMRCPNYLFRKIA